MKLIHWRITEQDTNPAMYKTLGLARVIFYQNEVNQKYLEVFLQNLVYLGETNEKNNKFGYFIVQFVDMVETVLKIQNLVNIM